MFVLPFVSTYAKLSNSCKRKACPCISFVVTELCLCSNSCSTVDVCSESKSLVCFLEKILEEKPLLFTLNVCGFILSVC